MPATHNCCGRSATNFRPTRSGRWSSPAAGRVVTGLRPRRTPWRPALFISLVPHLPDPVDAVVLLMNPLQLLDDHLAPQASSGCRPGLGGAASSGGDESTFCRTEDAADGLDPELLAMHVDERDHFVVGRSSSAMLLCQVRAFRRL